MKKRSHMNFCEECREAFELTNHPDYCERCRIILGILPAEYQDSETQAEDENIKQLMKDYTVYE